MSHILILNVTSTNYATRFFSYTIFIIIIIVEWSTTGRSIISVDAEKQSE